MMVFIMKLYLSLLLSFFCNINAFQFKYGLHSKTKQTHMMSSNPSSASSTSYLSQLQKALLARSGAAPPPGSIPSPAIPAPAVPTQSFQQQQQLQPQQLMEPTYQSSPEQEETEEENENGLPFSDAIYDEMKFVISKLSDRLKYKLVLSQKDFERFEASVLSIIRDARRKAGLPITPSTPTIARATASPSALFIPPQVTQMSQSSSTSMTSTITSTTSPKKAGVTSDEAFNSLKGKSSTWHVEGMDSMSTEEYYDALNKRNSAVRAELKITSGSERNSGDKYLDSLSKRTAESK